MRTTMTRDEWEEFLLPLEVEALKDYYFQAKERISPNEILEAVIQWNGGIATGYQVRSMISRIYGIELK